MQLTRTRKFFMKIGKRQRFILATFLLAIYYMCATFFSIERAFIIIPILALGVYVLTYGALLEGIHKHERIMLFIPTIYFSIVLYLFYFFVPQRWLTRLPFITIYIVSTYALLLCQNIFNVGVSKSIQLFRAAFSVNYLFLTICSFLAYSLIASLRLHSVYNGLLIVLVSFPLVVHMLWSVDPTDIVEAERVRNSALISLVLGEVGLILSFMPVNQSIFALTLTSLFYALTGIIQLHMQDVLFKERVREYVFVLGSAIVVLFLTLAW